ncbi:unnamed protein product [Porites evermanni]|uniref:Vps16 C-terminal domain-containing protein n=1 Tax=Porites evermanni TaxID=104178 RepID=A0ABN8QWD1_9CNID|nr:unnamed protein product [Porites evermanni]
MDLSFSDTIYQCILQGDLKAAEQLKKEFKIPDKRFYWLKVTTGWNSTSFPKLVNL